MAVERFELAADIWQMAIGLEIWSDPVSVTSPEDSEALSGRSQAFAIDCRLVAAGVLAVAAAAVATSRQVAVEAWVEGDHWQRNPRVALAILGKHVAAGVVFQRASSSR